MARNAIETIIGAIVLLVAALFMVFAYNTADMGAVEGYEVEARFVRAGGIQVGNDVRINGVKVGTVVGRDLDLKTYEAVVRMSVRPDIKLPADTAAQVTSEGLLGGRYVRLLPGQASEMVPAGGRLAKTQDFQSLEDLIGDVIFLATQDGAHGKNGGAGGGDPKL